MHAFVFFLIYKFEKKRDEITTLIDICVMVYFESVPVIYELVPGTMAVQGRLCVARIQPHCHCPINVQHKGLDENIRTCGNVKWIS